MGTPDFAVGTLKALLNTPEYQVQAVFTQPDKPKGRGKAVQMTPVKEVAVEAGVTVYQPVKIREPQWLEILQELNPDVIVVVAFGQIIPKSILELPKYGCINVHGSLLPMYRGAAPIQWAVINGDKESGVTTMRMDTGVDTGDMILKTVVPLAEDETGGSLFDKLSAAGAELLLETLKAIGNGTAQYEKQPAESTTSYAAMLTKQDGAIDWTKSATSIECLVRGMNPWPSAYTKYRGKTLKIWASAVDLSFDENNIPEQTVKVEPEDGFMPGTAVEVTKTSLKIQTGQGILSILEVQPEGKKRMAVDAFLRGYPVLLGEALGE